MKIHLLLACLIIGQALARDVLYSVVNSSPSSNIGVIINGQVYPLQRSSESSVLFQGLAPGNSNYTYAILGQSSNQVTSREEFNRPPVSGNTPNEFFGRNWNTKQLVSLNTIDSIPKHFNRRSDKDLHPSGEIPTIHVTAPQSEIDNMHKYYSKEITIKANITYIRLDSVKTFTGAKFEIGGRSSKKLTKFAYNIKLDKKSDDAIDGYKKLKLRTTVIDPAYMRDYLASEFMYAVNQPASRASHVRVFINDRPIGLFTIMEKFDKTWLANEFAAGSEDYKQGILYEAKGGSLKQRSDLEYRGDDPAAYNASSYEISEKPEIGTESFDDLMEFTKFIRDQRLFQKQATKEEISATIPEWEKRFEVEGFLATLAVEFMSGMWDNYLLNTNNYFLYKCPDTQKFYYITWDYDHTFGNGPVSMKQIAVGDYRSYGGFDKRPLTVAIFNVQEFRALFEKHLETIATSLFSPAVVQPVVNSIASLIKDDVEWDKSLPHVRKGVELLPSDLDNLESDVPKGQLGIPDCFSATTAADYLIRINSDIPFKKAIEGKTGHSSVYGIMEWFRVKSKNYEAKSTYKPLIPFLPLKRNK